MSDELLRHLALKSGEYAGMRVFDPKTSKNETVFTGQTLRLMMSFCHHANVERICFVGRETLMDETGLNGMSIDTAIRKLLLAGVIKHLGKSSYKGSLPVNNYLIDFPDLQPVEDVLTAKEMKKRARLLKASTEILSVDSGEISFNVLPGGSMGSLDTASSARHKQKQVIRTLNEYQLKQEWSHGLSESEPSEEEAYELLHLRDSEELPF